MSSKARPRPPEGDLERWARMIVSADLGIPVDRVDDGTANAQVDALIRFPSGVVPLEVVGDHDSAHLAMWNRLRPMKFRLEVDPAAQGWIVWLKSSAKIAHLERVLPALLADYDWPEDPYERDVVPRQLRSLGIVGVQQLEEPGLIRLQPEGWHSWDDPIDFVPWIARVLTDAPDVAAKLRAFGAAEAHAFIWATSGSAWSVNSMLRQVSADDPALPVHRPPLPVGVTDVWVASTLTRRGCLHWSSSRGWRRTGWVTVEEPDLAAEV